MPAIKLGLRQKLVLVFTTIILLGGLALVVNAGRQLEQATLEFYEHDLESAALNAAAALAETMEHHIDGESADSATIQRFLERSSNVEGQTFTVLDAARYVLASTYTPRYPINEVLPGTEEINNALFGGTVHTLRPDENGELRLYVGAPIRYESQILGVVRSSAPVPAAYEAVRQKWVGLAVASLPILLLTVAASLWMGSSIARPIQKLHDTALHIAEGALDEQAEVSSNDEIGELAAAFNYMTQRINTLLAAQRSFVSNAAHELRNPLMTLKLRVELLRSGNLPPEEQATYLQELAGEIDRMTGLINQLLILARLDEKRHQTDDPPDDAVAFLSDLARNWRIQAQQAGITWQADIAADLPAVPIPASDLRIVLDNLVNNAIKYTGPEGEIRLAASCADGKLRLIVSDSGEGFNPEDGEQIFDRFFRADRSRSRDVPGTGLGLSIVQAVVAHNGGTVSASSAGQGKGAAFTVTLPLNSTN